MVCRDDMRKLPTVPRPDDLIDTAFARAKKAGSKAKGPLGRRREVSIAKVESVADTLMERLETLAEAYASFKFTPFSEEMLSIRLGLRGRTEGGPLEARTERLLGAVRIIRKLRSQHIARIVRSFPSESMDIRKAFYGRAMSVVKGIDKDLSALYAARGVLLRVPDIRPDMPVVAVAGFPNSGKSSFLRRVSSGKPKVAPYPFTTQEIHVGHARIGRLEVQFLDTPGLLDRDDGARNDIEARAVAALRHLPDLVLFLIDLTETSGPIDGQLHLLGSLRELFVDVDIIPVFTKCDAVERVPEHPGVEFRISSLTGEGVDALLREIERRLRGKDLGTGDAGFE
jgi:nucleolar GTP-binding protein